MTATGDERGGGALREAKAGVHTGMSASGSAAAPAARVTAAGEQQEALDGLAAAAAAGKGKAEAEAADGGDAARGPRSGAVLHGLGDITVVHGPGQHRLAGGAAASASSTPVLLPPAAAGAVPGVGAEERPGSVGSEPRAPGDNGGAGGGEDNAWWKSEPSREGRILALQVQPNGEER